MSNKAMKLRPHHGMCLAFFVGEGYSGGFSAHMAQVLASLTPEFAVQLSVSADTICSQCPNNLDGLCRTAEKAARYDQAVLTRCGLRAGRELPFSQFTALVQRRILDPGLRQSICGDCQWNSLCASQPSRWKK